MTDMNALDRQFLNAGRNMMAAWLLGAACAAALLSGCASPIASSKVDPASPIAADVARLATTDKAYPKFSDVPPAPKDLLPPHVYGQRAQEVVAARSELERATAPHTWTLGGTAAFAARARAEAGPDLGRAARDTEAFASEVRKRATPPPPVDR